MNRSKRYYRGCVNYYRLVKGKDPGRVLRLAFLVDSLFYGVVSWLLRKEVV